MCEKMNPSQSLEHRRIFTHVAKVEDVLCVCEIDACIELEEHPEFSVTDPIRQGVEEKRLIFIKAEVVFPRSNT